MATAVLRVDPVAPDTGALREAAMIVARGGVVAFPTETFYGLGAAALDPHAVRRVFEIKGRPSSMPLLVLIDDVARLSELVAEIPERARPLIARHWPGALTLVFRASGRVPAEITAGTGTVGVRVSSHPVARVLCAHVAVALTAPSANPTGAPPPTTADAVLGYFDDALDLVVDAGPTAGGPPSTVLDVSVDPPRVIRQGAVRVDA